MSKLGVWLLLAVITGLLTAVPVQAKECYSPDARSRERAFSRAVLTEGGKTVWLAGDTASSEQADFEGQVSEVFDNLDKTIKAVGVRVFPTWLP